MVAPDAQRLDSARIAGEPRHARANVVALGVFKELEVVQDAAAALERAEGVLPPVLVLEHVREVRVRLRRGKGGTRS